MPFSVKIKGRVIQPQPSDYDVTDAPNESFPFDAKDHADSLAWVSYISMCNARNQAVDLWREAEALDKEIDARPDHPKRDAALKKLFKLRDKVNEKQIEYLKHERAATYCWRFMSINDRKKYNLTHWFNTPPHTPDLYGSWYTTFESADKPPGGFHLCEVPLLAIPPEQKRGYLRVRMGGDYHEPE